MKPTPVCLFRRVTTGLSPRGAIFIAPLCALVCFFAASRALAQDASPPPSLPPDDQPAVIPVPDPAPASPAQTPAAPTSPAKPAADSDDEPEVIVYTKDGRRFAGLLSASRPEEMVLRVAGVLMTLPTSDVEKYQILPPLLERYRDLKASAGTDPEQLLRIAEWLQARDRFELALTEVNAALKSQPDHSDAKRLKILLEEQIRLKFKAAKPPAPATDPAPNPIPAAVNRPKNFPTLSPAHVNLIKVYELDLADNPRFLIPRETVERMLNAYAANPLVPSTQEGRDALIRRPANEILSLMFDLRAREFYTEVNVLDQPRSMVAFRDKIARTWLNNSCATTQCHGGTEAGRLVLLNQRPAADIPMYTNLLILSRFKTAKGQPLINWENPERSILLQMGLPRDKAISPHPEVLSGLNDIDAWKPVFRSRTDQPFRDAVAWIKRMRQPRVDWPIDYQPFQPFEVTVDSKSKRSVIPPKQGDSSPKTDMPAEPIR